jgi:hypothetical protein
VIRIAPNGYIYAGGNFTSMNGVAANHIVKYNGATWSALGAGTNAVVYAIAFDPNGLLYAGGAFTQCDGSVNANYIASWDGTNWAYLGPSSTVNGVTGFGVYAITVGLDGSIYVGGSFTSASGVLASNIAKWNGSFWSMLGSGTSSIVEVLVTASDGTIYASGTFSTAGGVSLPDHIAIWNGSVWMPLDIDLPGNAEILAILLTNNGYVYLGYNTSGSAVSATVGATVSSSSIVWPKITFTGPGRAWQLKNYTTGKSIYLNLTLLAGETAVLNLDPLHFSFISSFRGNLLASGAILSGSNTNFPLMPGSNNVSTYMYGSTTAASSIVMEWQGNYNSLDGAAWK